MQKISKEAIKILVKKNQWDEMYKNIKKKTQIQTNP